ncbi:MULTISPECIES: bifunctional GNAT family N-acetyltransferase/nucleoside triphosphate pyrophosphohydrolase family protein [Actinomyces]|uniref:bifunctional GNAT family N-acetyltransferase/nucleoside triphosphate pyrophosphohydrolase family protein n=1 Tax=Actinomyces TaxID=1654 RepID=UPI000C76D748|nr:MULTISPECIES: bifunctional GNAT family N-acetyltransferase/nucleoside triphosphate pyrophosphohydrolase family protein [Actinomyces]PKY75656.1 phosphoribosyl-ATP diphosphatase [Actinomyces oris]QQQ60307.1 GNAT family N-acetyltransferase [Actinomyces sp. HMT 175]
MDSFEMTVAADGDLPALVLSVPTGDDLDRITDICQDADIQEWTFVPRNYQRSDAQFFVEQVVAKGWSEGRELTWAIREADAGAPPDLVGMLGITLSGPEGARTGEVGYWLAAAARGRGTMTRAVAALIDTAFDPSGPLALSALRWRCDIHETSHGPVPNWASWKVAWSLGFQREGRVRRFLPNDGRLHDGWIATLLPDDPREPRAPWDGPVETGGVLPLVAHDGVGEREGDDPEALVRRFHHVYGLPVQTDGASLERESLDMRMSLIAEEFSELVGAVYGQAARAEIESSYRRAVAADDGTRDTVETADALADLIYVIYGMALETGIDLASVLAEVQRSNMSKLGADGKPVYREDGKVLKGPDYFPPNVEAVLRRRRLR